MSPVPALTLVVVVCSLVLANPVLSEKWTDLRVTYSHEGPKKGYFQMPRTAAEAKTKGLVHPPEHSGQSPTDTEVLCHANDPTLCLVYDKHGFIAGIQIGVQKKGLVKTGYPFDKHHSFVPQKRFNHEMYITTLYFVPQTVLKSGGRTSLAEFGTGSGLWLQDGTKMFQIPRLEKDIGSTLYKKQKCMNGMGYHYYYNMNENLRYEDFHPIFGLYSKGELVGFGFQTFGKQTPLGKTWFETFPTGSLNSIITHPPQFIKDRVNAGELISLHTFFVDKPWDIKC